MNPFLYEKSVAERLEAAAIRDLVVMTSAETPADFLDTISLPTAVVTLGDELASQSNTRAALAEVTVLVYIVLRGALPERTDDDYFYREEVFQALHGEELEGLTSELEWRSTESDYQDNARTYRLTFSARLTKRKRAA